MAMPEYVQQELVKALEAYDDAADKFFAKVETGQARSVETYRELTAAQALSLKARAIVADLANRPNLDDA